MLLLDHDLPGGTTAPLPIGRAWIDDLLRVTLTESLAGHLAGLLEAKRAHPDPGTPDLVHERRP